MKVGTRIPFFLILVCLAGGAAVLAQVGTSNITGTVKDASGAAVPGAAVVAEQVATGLVFETLSSSTGTFALNALPPGEYTITISLPGFRKFLSRNLQLTVGSPLIVDAMLEIGEITQVVEVMSAAQKLETSNAMVSDVVERKAVEELPLNGRNPLSLITLQPGLVQRTTNSAGSGTHVFGSRDRSHNVTVDGIDANESSVPNPQSNILRLNPDNVQEYRVVTHNATPEFGRNSGANVAIATRQGTNNFHGDLFYFHRNTALNTNEWFNNAKQLERPVLLLHQYGLSVGGPIKKDKTFFFYNFQDNKIKQSQPIDVAFGTPVVYTALAKSGQFRFLRGAVTVDGVSITRNSPLLVDKDGNLKAGIPVCGASVTTNCVDTYNILDKKNDPLGIGSDPKIAALINSLPLPNGFNSGDGLNTGSYAWNPPSRFVGPINLIRIDHSFNDSNNLFGRMTWSVWDTTEGDFLNGRPKVFPGFPPLGEVQRRNQNLAIGYRRVLSPSMVNEFTTGFNRFNFFFTWGESNPDFGNIDKVPPYGQVCAGTDSFRNISTPYCDTPHTARAVTTLQFIDNFSWLRGSHSMRFGFNIRLYQHNDSRGFAGGRNIASNVFFDQSLRQGRFLNLPTSGSGAGQIDTTDLTALQNAIVEMAGIVAGIDQAFNADLGGNRYPPGLLQALGTRAKQFNFYAQDEWRATKNLTLTYGVRWEINKAPTDAANRTFAPDKKIDGSEGLITFVPSDRWIQRNSLLALAPRIGVAWQPLPKTVLRLGYGMAFDTLSTFQVTAIGGMVPGSALDCRLRLTDGSSGVSASVTNGCSIPSNIDGRLSQNFPLVLPTPSARPRESFSPPAAPSNIAPNTGAFDPDIRIPTVHEWSLTLQYELPAGFVVQAGYIGKRGTRLYRAYNLNQINTNQPGFKDSFLLAQQNVRAGCSADGAVCPSGVTGQRPDLLLSLVSASFLNSSTSRTDLLRGGLGNMANRIDQLTGSNAITAKGFAANYFRPNPQFTQIFYMDSGGSSSYHGAILDLRRRFAQGLTMGFSYTLSKSIDDMSVDPVGASSGGGLSTTNSRTPSDVRNFQLDRAVSDFDNTHVLVANGLWEVPFGRGRRFGNGIPTWVDHFLGGWQFTGIYNYSSGEPFTINSGVFTVHNTKQARADVRGTIPSPGLFNVPGIQGPVVWQVSDLDAATNCRTIVGTDTSICIPEAGSPGAGRNIVRGPGFWNFDLGIIKNFRVTEGVRVQFRGEIFNVFNHPNFENPRNATSGSPTLTSSLFGQTCCVTAALPSSATIIATGEPNRVIQFGLKINF